MGWAPLLVWGALTGLDLVSVPQVMIARPLVAATVAGLLAGDLTVGVATGVVLELFALDTLPVGASRYPDFGPAAVAGTAAGAGMVGVPAVGLAVLVGLVVALIGEWSLTVLRRVNSWDVRRCAEALDAGDPGAIRAAHYRAIGRDAVRAVALTAVGLAIAGAARQVVLFPDRQGVLLVAVLIGAALATGAVGALRLVDRPRGVGWFAAGVGLGFVWVILR